MQPRPKAETKAKETAKETPELLVEAVPQPQQCDPEPEAPRCASSFMGILIDTEPLIDGHPHFDVPERPGPAGDQGENGGGDAPGNGGLAPHNGDADNFVVAPTAEDVRRAANADGHRRDLEWLPFIDGRRIVTWDRYPDQNRRTGEYVNWKLRCGRCPGFCVKTRGVNEVSTRLFGEVQPLAYLYAWHGLELQAGSSHAKINPTPALVAACVAQRRVELEAVVASFAHV